MKIVAWIIITVILFGARGVRADLSDSEIVIEALIDGPSELRVKKGGIYWVNGDNAKPGLHEGAHEPTYINGKPWHPQWKNRKPRGADKSNVHELSIDPSQLDFELLAVSGVRGATGIEKRDPIQVNRINDELSIVIPDSQVGARWYKFALRKKAN